LNQNLKKQLFKNITIFTILIQSRDSAVGIVTGYGLDD
jgi:hypothetical protein